MHFAYPQSNLVSIIFISKNRIRFGWMISQLCTCFCNRYREEGVEISMRLFLFFYTWATKEKRNTVDMFFFFFFCSEKLIEKSGRKMRIDASEIWNRFAGFFIRNSYKLKIRDGIFCIKHAFRKLLRIIWCRECVESS